MDGDYGNTYGSDEGGDYVIGSDGEKRYYRPNSSGGGPNPAAPNGAGTMAFTSPTGRHYNDDSDLEGQLLAQGYSGPRDHDSMHAAWLNAEPGGGPSNDPNGLLNYDAAHFLDNSGLSQAKLALEKARLDTIDKPGMDSLIAYRKAQSDLENAKLQWLREQQQKNWDIANEQDAVRNAINIWQQQGRQANEFGQGTGLYAAPSEQPDLPNRYKMDQYVRDFQYRYPGQQPDNTILDQLFPIKLPPGATMTPGQVAPPHGNVPAVGTPAATPGTPAPTPAAATPAAAVDPYARWQPPDNFMGDKIPGWQPPKEWNWPPDWPDRVARWRRGEPLSPPAAAQATPPAPAAATPGKVSALGMPDLPENQPNGGQQMAGYGSQNTSTMPDWRQAFNAGPISEGSGGIYGAGSPFQVHSSGSGRVAGTPTNPAAGSQATQEYPRWGSPSQTQGGGYSAQGGGYGGQAQTPYTPSGTTSMRTRSMGSNPYDRGSYVNQPYQISADSTGTYGGQNSYGSSGYGAQGGYNTQPYPSQGGYGSQGGPNPYSGQAPTTYDPLTGKYFNKGINQQQQDLQEWQAKNNWEQQQAALLGRFNGQETLGGRAQTMAEQQAQRNQEYQAAMMRANPANYAVTAALAGNPAWGGTSNQSSQGSQGGQGGRPPWQQGVLGNSQGQEQGQNWLGVPNPRQMTAMQYQRMRPDEQAAFGSAVKSTGRSLEDWQNEQARYQPNQAGTMQTARWR